MELSSWKADDEAFDGVRWLEFVGSGFGVVGGRVNVVKSRFRSEPLELSKFRSTSRLDARIVL